MISGCLDRQCVIDVRELDCDDENAYLSNDGAGLGDWIRYRKIQRRGFARELRHRRNKFVNALISRFNMAGVGDETDTCGTHKDCNEEQCLNSSVPQSSAPASREATEQARLGSSHSRFDKAVRRMNTFTVMNASRLSLTLMPQTSRTTPRTAILRRRIVWACYQELLRLRFPFRTSISRKASGMIVVHAVAENSGVGVPEVTRTMSRVVWTPVFARAILNSNVSQS